MFLHYLAKQTNTKIASFHSMSYDYFIENFKNTLCMDCLLIVSFCYQNSLQQVFKMCPPFAQTHACRRFLHSLTAASTTLCCRLLQTSTSRRLSSSTLWICISYTRCYMIPKSCNQWGSGPDCWGGIALELSLIHISEPTRLGMISYAVFCLKKKS